MNVYFDNITTLHQFTLELSQHQGSLQCDQCQASDQFVSHGFVYKYLHLGVKETVGKRILCSDRHGKSGCGKTFRLYLAKIIPAFTYTAAHLSIFLTYLIAGFTIQQSYQSATHTEDSRNAYRWLNKLESNLVNYRGFLKTRSAGHAFTSRTRRLQLLLSTTQQLFTNIGEQVCTQYQLLTQQPFI